MAGILSSVAVGPTVAAESGQGTFGYEEIEADDAHQKADDRRSGRAALFSPAYVSWI